MKRVAAAIFFAVSICVLAVFSADAQSKALLYLDCKNSTDNNRLFYVDVYAQGDAQLSGAKITLSYDGKMLAYRKVSSELGEVKAHDESSCVTFIFANIDGIDIKDSQPIASIRFKSLRSGNTSISISCDELIAENYDYINVSDLSGCELQINGNIVTQKSKQYVSTKDDSKSGENFGATLSQSAVSSPQSYFAKFDNRTFYIVFIITSCAAFVILLSVAVVFGAKKQSHKSENSSDAERKSQDK